MTHTDVAAPTLVGTLTAADIVRTREVLAEQGVVTPSTRFVYLGLEEPDKDQVIHGRPIERRTRAMLIDTRTGASLDAVVSVDAATLVSVREVDGTNGQVPILDEEFESIQDILQNNPQWCAAIRRRGIEPETVALAPLSAGNFGHPDEAGRRVIRVLGFHQRFETDHCWAHPVDGMVAYVDMVRREMFELIDDTVFTVPMENGNFNDPELAGPPLATLKPIEITQPQGPSFTVGDSRVTWANWQLDVEFDAREGLVLRNIGYRDGAELRPIIYRASIAEMVVPYGDPSPVRYWQNYFDTGEYIYGRYTNSLKLGCDCLGEIHYLDGVLADEFGNPRTIPNAICMHEEDFGTLWKHTDQFTGVEEVRRQRRLVISFFTTVGNYDYGFYWYFYLDGTIECEAKLTGVLFTTSHSEANAAYATKLADDLGAPYHQHLFSARLDVSVDGALNTVSEIEAVRLPMGEGNPYGNAFTLSAAPITNEADAARLADSSVGRVWHIHSADRVHRTGTPTGYALLPQTGPTLMADPDSVIARRAAFARKHLWVTRYDRDERYPSGDFVNQNDGQDGLPAYQAKQRNLEAADIVLWHTFGPTHFPRAEDWPVMPVDYAKFTMKPVNFFARNPTLNVPPSTVDHCAAPGAADHGHHTSHSTNGRT
ncbi:primary-amine oxidase [Millisia brevis]|uniref:primary-amine oxidase n=1 Tax=Millisia brevis TaxID=264148 RepID=UPI00082C3FED|nr:primary-amine oxidase [Millisia brevis]